MKKLFFKLKGSGLLMFALLLLCAVFGITGAEAMTADITGVPEDTPLTHQEINEDTNLLEIDYGKEAIDIGRDVFLLTTMTDEIGNRHTCTNVETGVFEYGEQDGEDTVVDQVAGANLVGGNLPNTFKLANPSNWKKGDTLIVPSVVSTDGKPLFLRIESSTSTTVACKVMNPIVTGAVESFNTIPANASVIKLGKAMDELTGKVDSKLLLPSPHTNYCQTFMETIIASHRQLNVRKKVQIPFSVYLEQKMRDYKQKRELARLIGVKSLRYDADNREIYTSDGVFHMAKNTFGMTAWNNDNYTAMCRDIFETGYANGSGSKILLCGASFMAGLTHVEAYSKVFQSAETEAVFGVKCKAIDTGFGILYPKYHRLLTGAYSNKAIALDIPYVRIDTLQGEEFQTSPLTDNDDQRVKGVSIWESSCVVLENEMSHCVVTGA
jgi:hypothetical protein